MKQAANPTYKPLHNWVIVKKTGHDAYGLAIGEVLVTGDQTTEVRTGNQVLFDDELASAIKFNGERVLIISEGLLIAKVFN